jgi:hypothetical protein
MLHTHPYVDEGDTMRLNPELHRTRRYRVQSLAPDFELLDAWAFPILARPSRGQTFARFLKVLHGALDNESGASPSSRFLFRLRATLGRIFGWDRALNSLPIPGCSETSLRQRLSEEERRRQRWYDSPHQREQEFRAVYADDLESIAEISNGTLHAILHVSWVELEADRVRPELGVYVKHRGWFGPVYMALIAPFRHFVIYPALLRRVASSWERASDSVESAPAFLKA